MSDQKNPTKEPAAAATEDAPIEQSLEEAALDRARAYVTELEAQAKLHDELSEPPPEAAAEPAAPPTREESDARALEEFQRLRERSPKKSL